MIVVWVVEETWEACVDAARDLLPPAPVTLLHVVPAEVTDVPAGALAGLLGRGRRQVRPPGAVDPAAERAAEELLAAAAERLGRAGTRTAVRSGRVEREVVAACRDADALVVARDGDLSRVGPASLGRDTRFVVDHAPCPVLLVWPGRGPDVTEPPPLPPPGSRPAPPPPPPA